MANSIQTLLRSKVEFLSGFVSNGCVLTGPIAGVFTGVLAGVFTVLLTSSWAWAKFAEEPPAPVRLEISEDTVVRTEAERAGKPLLVTETTLPSGSIVEIISTRLENPTSMAWWKDSKKRSPIEFVQGIRIISAPGLSQKEIDDLNRINREDGLFMAKIQIDKGRPIEQETEKSGDPVFDMKEKTDRGDNSRQMRFNEPSTAYFDQVNMGRGVRRDTQSPSETNQPASERLSIPDLERALARVREANAAIDALDEINPANERCDIEELKKKALDAGISERPLQLALEYFNKNKGKLRNQRYITIIDFSMPSSEKRMFIIDTTTGEVTRHLASHGIGSDGGEGKINFKKMSNVDGSHATPPGFLKTAETYQGKYGYSLRLDGLEKRNDETRERDVVLHPADYASAGFVKENGFLGRSWGCPAVDPKESKDIIDRIKGGSLLYHYNGE